jgi:hypothetical protein
MPIRQYITDIEALWDNGRDLHQVVDDYIDQLQDEERAEILALYGARDLSEPTPEAFDKRGPFDKTPPPLQQGWDAMQRWWERVQRQLAFNALYQAACAVLDGTMTPEEAGLP